MIEGSSESPRSHRSGTYGGNTDQAKSQASESTNPVKQLTVKYLPPRGIPTHITRFDRKSGKGSDSN